MQLKNSLVLTLTVILILISDINLFSQVTVLTANGQDASCSNVCDGELELNIISTDGTGPYEIIIQNAAVPFFLIDTLDVTDLPFTYTDLCPNGTQYSVFAQDQSFAGPGSDPGQVTNVSITSPPGATITFMNSTTTTCNDSCDGSIVMRLNGSTPINYVFSNGLTGSVPNFFTAVTTSGFCGGDYTMTTTDNNGCTRTFTTADNPALTVNEPAPIDIVFNTTNPTCKDKCDGLINANVSGGTSNGTYVYNWTGSPTGDGTNSISELCDGSYTLQVIDNNNCPAEATTGLTEPTGLDIDTVITNVLCAGDNTGKIDLDVSGGTPGYTFAWSPNVSSTDSATNLTAGTYEVTVTDNDGLGTCPQELTLEVLEPDTLKSNIDGENIDCFGDNSGFAFIDPSGGTPPYNFNWNIPNPNDTLFNLTAGTYSITLTDAFNCETNNSITLVENGPIISNTDSSDISCNSFTDGQASVSPTGGTGNYTYMWSSSQTTPTITNLSAGTYYVTITDDSLCSIVDSVIVNEPAPFNTNFISTNVSCFGAEDGTATSTPIGGTPPYTYNWTDGGIAIPGAQNTDSALTDLSASNNYALQIIDGAGCPVLINFSINENPDIQASITLENNRCFGHCNGTATASPTGGSGTGYTIEWSTGVNGNSINSLCADNYTVTITDNQMCSVTESFTITEGDSIEANLSMLESQCNQCNGTAITAPSGGSGNLNILWQDGSNTTNTFPNACPEFISLTITDDSLCVLNDSILVTTPSNLEPNPLQTNVSCSGLNDGAASVNPVGGTPGYTFEWSHDALETSSSINQLTAGTYTVSIIDAEPCTTIVTFNITESSILLLTGSQDSTSCSNFCDGQAKVEVSGGEFPYSYAWSHTNTETDSIAEDLCIGDVTVTVTDNIGCSETQTISINPKIEVVFGITVVKSDCNNMMCDGTAEAVVSGGIAPYNFNWSDGISTTINANTTQADSVCTGPLILIATDQTGCQGRDSVFMSADTNVLQLDVNETPITCNGNNDGALTAILTGGTEPYSYQWNTSAADTFPSITNLAPGIYSVTVTDSALCSVDTTFILTEPDVLRASASVINISCNDSTDGIINTQVTGGTAPYSYNWTSNVSTVDSAINLMAGTYQITVTDDRGCTETTQETITEPSEINVTITASPTSCNDSCDGSAVAVVSGGTGNFTNQWDINTGFQTGLIASDLCAGNYDLTTTDDNNCSITNIVTIIEPIALTVDFTTSDLECHNDQNGSITTNVIGGIAPYNYQWSVVGETGSSINNLDSGIYFVTISDQNNCAQIFTDTILSPDSIIIAFNTSDLLCSNTPEGSATAIVTGGTPNFSYSWDDPLNQTTPTANNLQAGVYNVVVEDINGCIATNSIEIFEPSPMQGSPFSDPSDCIGTTGSARVFPLSGGAPPYIHSWNTGATSVSLSSVPGGVIYTDTIRDSNGCILVVDVPVSEAGGPTSATLTANQINCFDSCNGSVAVAGVLGGLPPYNYLWNDPSASTTSMVTDLCTDTLLVIIEDANGCAYIPPRIIIGQPDEIEPNLTVIDESCIGASNGTIASNPSGGNAPYEFIWMDGSDNPTLTDLTQGNYSLTITDVNNCSKPISTSINVSPNLNVSIVSTNVNCNGDETGSLEATVTGGISPIAYQWGVNANNATNNTVNNLSEGTYNLTVTDNAGCTVEESAVIQQNDEIISVATITNTLCGFSQGEVTTTTSGGTSPYSYNWLVGGQSSSSISSQLAGIYPLVITDFLGCRDTFVYVVTNTNGPTLTKSITNVTCFDGNNGSATIAASEGTPPYSYNWVPNISSDSAISNVTAGEYYVEVTDANNCSSIDTVVISEPLEITVDFTKSDPLCNGSSDGQILATISNAIVPVTYAWDNGDNVPFITDLNAGSYSITVQDARGCQSTQTINLVNPEVITISETIKDLDCDNDASGQILVSATGGTPGYSFDWNNGTNGPVISNLDSGSYTVIVTDDNNCTTSGMYVVNEPNPIEINSVINNTNCGLSFGSITATPSGGVGAYLYSWSPGASITGNLSSLSAGVYQLTITDANDCRATEIFNITNTDGPIVSVINDTLNCYQGTNGILTAVVSGGSSPTYSYVWNDVNLQNTATASGLTNGLYQVIVTDDNNCPTIGTAEVVQPEQLIADYTFVNPDCNTLCDLEATITTTGGTGNYNFIWPANAASQTTATAINLCGGNYIVTITDGNLCEIQTLIELVDTSSLDAQIDFNNISCNNNMDGYASVTAMDGLAPYSFTWSNSSSNPFISNLDAGTFIVTVTDQQGCEVIDSVVITQPTELTTVTTSTDILCSGDISGSANTIVNGGSAPYQYNWSPNGGTTSSISNLENTTHYVTITDNNGCTTIDSTEITQPEVLTATFVLAEPDCNTSNGSVAAIPTGGTAPYTYAWSNADSDSIANDVTAGSYSLTITDNVGCTIELTQNLSNSDGPEINLLTENVSCGNTNDGMSTVEVISGDSPYTYLWNNNDNDSIANDLVAAIYTVTVTDANNCLTIQSDTIINSVELDIISTVNNISCNSINDGSISLSVSGGTPGYNYNWSPTQPDIANIQNLVVGTYDVTISDAGSCQSVESFNITKADPISLNASITNIECFNQQTGTVIVNATGGVSPYTYSWSNADMDNEINNLEAGSYTVTITDNANCTFDSTILITNPSSIEANFAINEANCNQSDGSISVTPSGGSGSTYTYEWLSGITAGTTDSLVDNVPAGLYGISITDSLNCTQQFTAALSNLDGPTISLSIVDVTCIGNANGSASVIASEGTPPYTYEWHNGVLVDSIVNQMAGEITITTTDADGCITSLVDSIDEGADVIIIPAIVDISCNGNNSGSITLAVSGGSEPYAFQWASSTNITETLNNLAAGTYYYTVSDAQGCSKNDSATVENITPVELTYNIDSIFCFNDLGNINITVSGGNTPYQYSWDNGSITESLLGVLAGSYSLTVTDANNCTIDTTITLVQPDEILISYITTNPTCNLDDGEITASATGGVGNYTYEWGGDATGQTGELATGLFANVYELTVTDANNCAILDSAALSNVTGPTLTLDSLRNASCFGYTDGYIYLNVLSTDTPLTYLWSSGETTEDLENIGVGGYSITITDTLNCKAIDIYEITEPDSFFITAAITNVTCKDICDGTALVNETGGTIPYQYTWDDPLNQTTQTASGLCDGTYNVIATDTNNCEATAQIEIEEPDSLITTVDLIADAVCSQSTEGEISVTTIGGTIEYNYNWTGPEGYASTSEDIIGLLPGEYNLIVTDENNCTFNLDTVVGSQIVVSIDSLIATDTSLCLNELPISINSFATGIDLSYEWQLNGTTISSDSILTNQSPPVGENIYSLAINFSGCNDNDTVLVSVEDAPIVDAGITNPIIDGLCRTIGGNPTAANGVTYSWTPELEINSTTIANPEVCPDETTVYTVEVTSANGCIASDSVTVIVFPEISFIEGFTPNNDGTNDVWVIQNLQDFPDVVVEIYNRWGQLLWQSDVGYTVPWDGLYKGKELPVGTYYYIIELNRPEFPEPITGPITIVR